MFERRFVKKDGRRLYLYGDRPHTLEPLTEPATSHAGFSHLRWHPLRGEWVINSQHLSARSFDLSSNECPLCPGGNGATIGEIPFADFEVAIFENRYATFHRESPEPAELPVATAQALGSSEVVVYTPEHQGNLATVSRQRRELLVRAWTARYQDLYGREEIQYVYPFETIGRALGASLEHPHGQIRALSYLPSLIEREAACFRDEPVLVNLLARLDGQYILAEDEHTIALVPPCARFPYEVWVVPRRAQPGPWTFEDDEVTSFADRLADVVRCYARLVDDEVFPYRMLLHAAPKGCEAFFHFHVEFYPPWSPEGLQRRHGRVEFGFSATQVSPEVAAERLREVGIER